MPLFKTNYKTIPLIDDFLIPPFSYLDTKQKYWSDRRAMWLKYTEDLTESRDGDFGRTFNIQKEGLEKRTSTFDPVLAELMYKWFTRNPVKILDPFGGEQTKGIVAGALGYEYWGMELRQEQVDINVKRAENYPSVHYVCGDSNYIDTKIQERGFNFCFTSPPYYDLEVYSDNSSDISTKQSYKDFMRDLASIFIGCYSMLDENTFTVVKLGEVRDNNGAYYGFVPEFVSLMQCIGWKLYNEIILLNRVGSAAVRSAGNMKSRKVVKLHQNVLVFYKGDTKNVNKYFPEMR